MGALDRESQINLPLFNELCEHGCEFLITVAMYNEGANEMKNTMEGVVKNLKAFADAGIDQRKIACVIIADGIRPFMSTYQEDAEL